MSQKSINVLWFEVTTPGRYKGEDCIIGGWQDSLETILRGCPEIKLTIAFESICQQEQKNIDGVDYVPIFVKENMLDMIRNRWRCGEHTRKLILSAVNLVNKIKPDIIHVFGTEWLWGLIAKEITIPVVIHMQGSLIPYYNAFYPPGYSPIDVFRSSYLNIKEYAIKFLNDHKVKTFTTLEYDVYKYVNYYMGRTKWDHALVNILSPGSSYYHVEEALRDIFFVDSTEAWKIPEDETIRIFSTGCGSFWKGPDMLLKTASVLKNAGVHFEWLVAGNIWRIIKKTVERKERKKYEGNNVRFLGYISPEEIVKILSKSTIYVHTAYIENSPNSICEAQCLGVPIVSTNVGGISSLVEDGKDGILVPANDPWLMADSIISLTSDKRRMLELSKNSRKKALARHNTENIKNQLLSCYNSILKIENY